MFGRICLSPAVAGFNIEKSKEETTKELNITPVLDKTQD